MRHMHAYCLFCETQRCKIIAEYINRNTVFRCVLPQIIQRKWIKGIPEEESHDWLPGYLFLYTEEPVRAFFNISGIIRCLGNKELTGNDLQFAEMLYQRNGILGGVSLIQEGNRCRISDPAWENLQGRIIKMDHGRKRCCVEYRFDGITRTIWVGYEIVQPEEN